MKYSVAILAAVTTGALAQNTWGTWVSNGTVAYTTTIVTALTTYCPEAMEVTHGGNTYTVTEATTLTITDCPCTLTQPILTPSTLFYTSCPPGASSTQVPVAPPASPNLGPAWSNPLVSSATPTPIVKPNGSFANGTGVSPSKTPTFIITGGANANGVVGLLVCAVAGAVALAL